MSTNGTTLDLLVAATEAEALPEASMSQKTKAAIARNERTLDEAVRRVGQRDLARRPGHDPSMRVRHLEPEPSAAPMDNAECADCGLPFVPGDGRRRDAAHHDLLVHTSDGCERARRRHGRTVVGPQPVQPEETKMEAATAAPEPAVEPVPARNLILDHLAEHGPSIGGAIARALGRTTQNVTTRLRQMEAEGRVRRTGRSLQAGRGGPQIEWALADGSPPPESIDAPPPRTSPAHALARAERAEAIEHPAHYGGAENPYEAIKVIEAWDLGFHLGNTVKYIARAGQKGDALTDLKKARWYLDRQIIAIEGS